MRKYIALGLITIVLVAGVVYFSRTTASPPIDPRLIEADNDFAFRLYKEIAKKDGDRNIFISPISIVLALQMTCNGASGSVKEEMAKVLGIQGMTLNTVNMSNAGLFSVLANPGQGTELNIANSLWTNEKLVPEFKESMRQLYAAEMGPLNLNAINAWVSDETKGKIKKMLQSIDPKTIVMLVNAIYFKGEWKAKFDQRYTEDMHFQIESGKDKYVPMMYQKSKFAFMHGDQVSAIRLPYGHARLSMYIFLPRSLSSFLAGLNAKDWDTWMSSFGHEEDAEIYIPKFKLEYGNELKKQLMAMGMVEAFEGTDFANMLGGDGAWISEVKHKAVVVVNEEGTEAAAATAAAVTAGGPPLFMVDHPFFFVIRDDKTGLILFMGSVTDPTKQ